MQILKCCWHNLEVKLINLGVACIGLELSRGAAIKTIPKGKGAMMYVSIAIGPLWTECCALWDGPVISRPFEIQLTLIVRYFLFYWSILIFIIYRCDNGVHVYCINVSNSLISN